MLKSKTLWGDIKLGVSGGTHSSFTSPAETATNITVTHNKPKSCYIQYLHSGQVTPSGYGSHSPCVKWNQQTLLDVTSQQRYNCLATKHQQKKKTRQQDIK